MERAHMIRIPYHRPNSTNGGEAAFERKAFVTCCAVFMGSANVDIVLERDTYTINIVDNVGRYEFYERVLSTLERVRREDAALAAPDRVLYKKARTRCKRAQVLPSR